MDNIKFNPENIEKYCMRNRLHNSDFHLYVPDREFSTNAVMTLFDKNADGYISKKEFLGVTKEEYNSYVTDLKNYNEENGEIGKILNYKNLADLVDKGSVSSEELDLNIHEPYKLKIKNHPDSKNLKDSSQMSLEELQQELVSYGADIGDEYFYERDREDLKYTLKIARKERICYDANSDKIDYNVGTYTQGGHSLCVFLSKIENFSLERLKNLYSQKVDENGKVYYEINFPIDSKDPKPIIITDEELKSGEITYKNPDSDEEQSFGAFSQGDLDVKLLEMAVLNRFGDNFFKNGAAFPDFENILKEPDKEDFIVKYSLTPDELKSLKPLTTVSIIPNEVIKSSGFSKSFTLSDGRTGKFCPGEVLLSDGTRIQRGHSIAVKGYDPETQELIIQGNELNNLSELRVPLEMAKYLAASIPIEIKKD